MTYAAISQPSPNRTIAVPVGDLLKAMKQIEAGKAARQENELLQQNITILENRIQLKDSIIKTCDAIRSDYRLLQEQFIKATENAEKRNQLNVEWVSDLNRKLRRQKRKTIFVAIGGIIATGTAIYFLK